MTISPFFPRNRQALFQTTSLIAICLWAPASSQTIAAGEGFSISVVEEPMREDIYGDELSYADPDWFYSAIIDLTVGERDNTSPAYAEQSGDYAQGRIAGYANGPVGYGYSLTAAIDTTQEDLDEIFSGLGEKTPKEMLKRLDDPERYYPVYGDDSTFEETAPTIGRFYVRLENERNYMMWGNFKSNIINTEYLRNERTLYGAQAVFNSEATTPDERPRQSLEVFAASLETVSRRDVFRGTGGSSYFLKERDISVGSETLQVEIRDAVTGAILSRKTLTYGTDYKVNYSQGLILLNTPLSANSNAGSVVNQGSAGNEVYLVTTYEFEPATGDVDDYAYGGRLDVALSDRLRLGVTGQQQKSSGLDHTGLGADIEYQFGENSSLRVEYAETDGPGIGFSLSTDGGQILNESTTTNGTGRAIKLAFEADLTDLGYDGQGSVSGYIEDRTAGFSSLTTNITDDETLWGLDADVALSERTQLRVSADSIDSASGQTATEISAQAEYRISSAYAISAGLSHLDKTTPGDASETGQRTNAGIRLTRTLSQGNEIYAYGEGTLNSSGGLGNENRAGLGGTANLGPRTSVTGDVSGGTGGLGAKLEATYQQDADNKYYFGYVLDPKRTISGVALTGEDNGRFVIGGASKLNERVNTFAENTYDMFGAHRALTSAYGMDFAPNDLTTYSVALEIGQIDDPQSGDFERTAVSIGWLYKLEDSTSVNAKLEFRQERGQNRDADTILVSVAASKKLDESRRVLAQLDTVLTDASGTSVPNTEYIEASIGYALRPVHSGKTNSLFKYTYLLDDQTQTVTGVTTSEPAQRSHILSLDTDYAYSENLTLGAKVAVRLAESNSGSGWVENDAALGILTARYSINDQWDVVGDVRGLTNFSRDTSDFGGMVAAYRHLGKNVMIGAGYNFSHFSDDLSDMSFDDQGGFLNLIAKF